MAHDKVYIEQQSSVSISCKVPKLPTVLSAFLKFKLEGIAKLDERRGHNPESTVTPILDKLGLRMGIFNVKI